jgi:ribosomal subunit interface protein
MKITTKTTGLELTPSLKTYIEKKLGGLAKFVKRFDETGQAELWVGVARTTRHHRHGEVFLAEADLRLPKRILRAEEEAEDVRAAIDLLQRKLHLEIEKYKTKFAAKPTKRMRAASRPGK